MYDLIGDIHGNLALLEKLMNELGYFLSKGAYKHRTRKAIFIGDYINRGYHSREVVGIIKRMTLAGHALALFGNHEYNLVFYLTPDKNGNYLRPHTEIQRWQVEETIQSYSGFDHELENDIKWFRSLPILYENEDIRVVHAAWIEDHIGFLHSQYPSLQLTDDLLYKSADEKTRESDVIKTLIKGPIFRLPEDLTYTDDYGLKKNSVRLKWWEKPDGKSIRELAAKKLTTMPDFSIDQSNLSPGYGPAEKPVFFGHYCLTDPPGLLRHNVCCLDFCVYRLNRLAAYRWNGESKLHAKNLVVVHGN